MHSVVLPERNASLAYPSALPPATLPAASRFTRDRRQQMRDRLTRLPSRSARSVPTGPQTIQRVLIVTRDRELEDELRVCFEREGREVLIASQTEGTAEMVGRAEVDLVLIDAALPEDTGIELLEAVRAQHPAVFTGLLTTVHAYRADGMSSSASALSAAHATLLVPVDPVDVQQLLRRAETPAPMTGGSTVAVSHLAGSPTDPSTAVSPHASSDEAVVVFRGMYGSTPPMRDVFRMISRVGRTDVTVLVTGESGTGKELVARALHEESARRHKPFVALNCSALPSELVESELFGHTRGAFTGAVKDRGGLFEAAHGGTLFLDEIGDLGLAAQAKVLRALENGEVMRVGGTRSTLVDVRVIAATNRPLDEMVADGRFREDLLYRLKVISLALPPLRERTADIPLLATHFLQMFADRHGLPMRMISARAREILLRHEWPGNVRELRNVIEGALVMCDGVEIDDCDLPAALANPRSMLPASMLEQAADLPFVEAREKALREFDRAFLGAALARHGGNIARTARALGLHRQSLQKLLARRDLRQP